MFQFKPRSPQIVEFQIVLGVFQNCQFPLNLISDSSYVVNLVRVLEAVGKIKISSPIQAYMVQLQKSIMGKKKSFFYYSLEGSFWISWAY